MIIHCSSNRKHNKEPILHTKEELNAPDRDIMRASVLTIDRAEVIMKVRGAGCSSALHEEIPIRIWVAGHESHLVIVICGAGSWWRRGQAKKSSLFQMLMSYRQRVNGTEDVEGREITRINYFPCK